MMEEETEEALDTLDTMEVMPTASNQAVLEQILRAKKGDPSQFASYWEMDENDVDEDTEEEIRNNPSKRTLWAAENNETGVLLELIEGDTSLVNTQDKDGYTPVHRASYNGYCEALKVLLKSGADVNVRTNDGWTALHSACRWDQVETAAILIQHGIDINAQTTGGQTALHLAASSQESRLTLELLLTNRYIDASLKNSLGETALDLCQRCSNLSFLFEIVSDSVNKLMP